MQSQYPVVEAVLIGTSAISCSFPRARYYAADQYIAIGAEQTTAARISVDALTLEVFQIGQPERPNGIGAKFLPDGIRQRKKGISDFWIELRSAAPRDFGFRLLERQRTPVRPVRSHRVQRIGHGENARTQWNLFAFQAVRISRSIEFLLVRQHDLRDRRAGKERG